MAQVSYTNQVEAEDAWSRASSAATRGNGSQLLARPGKVRGRFREFIRNFREAAGAQLYPYRSQLLERARRGEHKLRVALEDLNNYDEELLDVLLKHPREALRLFEEGAKEALSMTMASYDPATSGALPDIQVLLSSQQVPTPMRSMSAQEVNKLLLVPGIVTSAQRVQSKATLIRAVCTACKRKCELPVPLGTDGVAVPHRCPAEGCEGVDTYKVLPDANEYIDIQKLKLQEAPEAVPTGEMPRSIQLLVDRALVDQVSPGARVKVIGIWSVRAPSGGGGSREAKQLAGGGGAAGKGGGGGGGGDKNVRLSFLHVVGIDALDAEGGRVSGLFSPEEEQTFHDLARQADVYHRIARSIAPAIQGDYTHDIKRAIACLLFGGSRRVLPDGMRLRGDVNVLMLGDPSTAKSQFLKFVERVAPIGVYTSGKGSSTAGLTASVIRDARGEFYLEGGAMVLADGGVVCIDEFDKMKEQDRVAIHEAMEQQTISVAKAGITTVLNARCSVLAAANPTHGTYDELKSAADNIDFMPTILSRFDLIFIVRDVRDPVKDRIIAKHVISVHVDAGSAAGSFGGGLHDQAPGRPAGQHAHAHAHEAGRPTHEDGEIDLATLKRFIRYCRLKCAPVLSAPAAEMLCNHYVGVREEMRKRERETADLRARQRQPGASGAQQPGGNATIPLTTRQLEAVVRLAEALAKMELSQEASTEHVAEAIRLFKVSTLNAANNNALPGDVSALSEEDLRSVQMVEEQIKRRVPIGSVVPQQKLMDEFVQLQGFKAFAVRKALQVMLDRGEIRHASQQKLIKRVR